jgi:hypothetical protein
LWRFMLRKHKCRYKCKYQHPCARTELLTGAIPYFDSIQRKTRPHAVGLIRFGGGKPWLFKSTFVAV